MKLGKPEFLQSVGLETRTLDIWIEQRWLVPEPTPSGPTFSDRDMARARFILDLKDTFGVNDEGVDVILHLVDQMHEMREALARLRKAMP
ncbi:chaperone modulator CbpM [Methylobacterium oryzisoli]|uniref:chaperone modulator CbpM n=1 Tax=Methylobacterium oryzisoli TaxID=3385502 RepID=UPI003891DF38